jgi:hypothetical protein
VKEESMNTNLFENGMKKPVLIMVAGFLSVMFAGCEKENMSPISLVGIGDKYINLQYPSDMGHNFPLQGGDGQYSVACDSPDIVSAVMISAVDMQLQALSVGDAVVTVSDRSGHTLQLRIYVDYSKFTAQISSLDVVVTGDLTDEEIETIRIEALRTIPVQAGGGYLFINDEAGTGIIYPDKFGIDGIECAFEFKTVTKISPDGEEFQMPAFYLNINGEERVFLLTLNNPYTFCEELTDKFKSEYPKVELVYTVQVHLMRRSMNPAQAR